jgi:hypothetical protein
VVRVGATAWSITNYDNTTHHAKALIAGVAQLIDLSPTLNLPNRWAEIGAELVIGRNGQNQSGNPGQQGPWFAVAGDFGIREQPRKKGFMYRLTFTPFYCFSSYSDQPVKGLSPSVGGSAGWVF